MAESLDFTFSISIHGSVQCSGCDKARFFEVQLSAIMEIALREQWHYSSNSELAEYVAEEAPEQYGWKWIHHAGGRHRIDLPAYCPKCIPVTEIKHREEGGDYCLWCGEGECVCPPKSEHTERQSGTRGDPWLFEMGALTGLNPLHNKEVGDES